MKNGQSRETGNIAHTRQSKPTQYVLDTTMHKQAQKKHKYDMNPSTFLATGGKDELNIIVMRKS